MQIIHNLQRRGRAATRAGQQRQIVFDREPNRRIDFESVSAVTFVIVSRVRVAELVILYRVLALGGPRGANAVFACGCADCGDTVYTLEYTVYNLIR